MYKEYAIYKKDSDIILDKILSGTAKSALDCFRTANKKLFPDAYFWRFQKVKTNVCKMIVTYNYGRSKDIYFAMPV